MMASQFLFMAEYFARLEGRLRWVQRHTASWTRHLVIGVMRRVRPYPPLPPLSDHLYRDLGIERPLRREEPGLWPW